MVVIVLSSIPGLVVSRRKSSLKVRAEPEIILAGTI